MDPQNVHKCDLCDKVSDNMIGPCAGGPVAWWCKSCKTIVERYEMKKKIFKNIMRKHGLRT